MGKVLCFVYESMADFETTLACHMVASFADKEIISFGYEKAPVKAFSKIQYMPDMTIKEAMKLEEVDALIIPGGFERDCKDELKSLIQKLHNDKKLICAICAAPEFLAKAGVLENHSYTTTLGEAYYKELGAVDCFPRENYLEEMVVRHENVVTAKGRAFVDFGIEILDYFNVFEDAADKSMCAKSYKGE
jgi:putative intracellular protease/amidase